MPVHVCAARTSPWYCHTGQRSPLRLRGCAHRAQAPPTARPRKATFSKLSTGHSSVQRSLLGGPAGTPARAGAHGTECDSGDAHLNLRSSACGVSRALPRAGQCPQRSSSLGKVHTRRPAGTGAPGMSVPLPEGNWHWVSLSGAEA